MSFQSPSSEASNSKNTMVVSSAGVKEEPEQGGVAHGGRGSPGAGATVAKQATQALERPRINISVDVQLLPCIVVECRRPLKPPVVKCEAGHLLCGACLNGGHCRKCDRASAFAHCGPELDVFISDARVSCPFNSYGCGTSIIYHVTATHQDTCAYASCQCAVPGCPFTATLPRLRDHLVPQHHHYRLPVVEGDERSLFLLSVCPCGGANGVASCAVSVSCVKKSATAEAGPRFTYMLWAKSPAAPPQQTISR
ncbi:hypothetical protein BDA96_02G134800 [Sorghum bicolor]|uniref:SIAH-type domain-containing protein n=2 Tax=Sorghum bicolor TaxID=4558 RepID=A0A921RM14_SORBI|nr:hypothetical protein BDA96_02G134800 [Sorghum bicolor]OQU88982.1 hypothetical protein SORBI_3002G128500 [Sorghum bicolor]